MESCEALGIWELDGQDEWIPLPVFGLSHVNPRAAAARDFESHRVHPLNLKQSAGEPILVGMLPLILREIGSRTPPMSVTPLGGRAAGSEPTVVPELKRPDGASAGRASRGAGARGCRLREFVAGRAMDPCEAFAFTRFGMRNQRQEHQRERHMTGRSGSWEDPNGFHPGEKAHHRVRDDRTLSAECPETSPEATSPTKVLGQFTATAGDVRGSGRLCHEVTPPG